MLMPSFHIEESALFWRFSVNEILFIELCIVSKGDKCGATPNRRLGSDRGRK